MINRKLAEKAPAFASRKLRRTGRERKRPLGELICPGLRGGLGFGAFTALRRRTIGQRGAAMA